MIKKAWIYLQTPKGKNVVIIALCVLLVVGILWFVFKKVPEDNSKDALIEHLQNENAAKDSAIRNTNAAIGMLGIQLEGLQKSFDKKGNEIIKIYERTERDVHHYDTASSTDLQGFFDNRYPAQ
jgi:hypothetical protein